MYSNRLAETIYVRHRGADMPAHIHGNATDKVFLIILHGGPGGTGLQTRVNTMITEVEQNNAVVYFDQRGSGNAQGHYAQEDVSLDLMADDVLALTEALKLKYGDESRFFLLGHSWGGTLGPVVLLKRQDEFLGWIDVAGAHNWQDSYDTYRTHLREYADEQIALGNSTGHWEDVRSTTETVGPMYSNEDFFLLNSAAHNSEAVLAQDGIINEPKFIGEDGVEHSLILRNNGQIVRALERQNLFRDENLTDRLSMITLPSLVLWGRHDLIVSPRFAQEGFTNLGGTQKELFFFERSGHSPMNTEPDLFAEKLIDFINRFR